MSTSQSEQEIAGELETELILCCSRTVNDPELGRRVNRILNNTLNWPGVFQIAGRNGLLPLVAWNLLRSFADLLPNDVRENLSEFQLHHTRNNLFQTLKVVEIASMLDAGGIPTLPFKGPSLAQQAYGDLSLRQYVDLDVLVQPKHFDKAVEILKDGGYRPISTAPWLKRKGFTFTRKKDIGLVSRNGQVRIELHWKLSGSHFAMPLEINQLWNRLETIDIGSAKLNSLPFRDLFVYLCLHGSRHGWEKFAWICDLNELIRTAEENGTIDWAEVRTHARQHGCERVVELGLFLVYEFFDRRTNYPDFVSVVNNKALKKIGEMVRIKAFTASAPRHEIGDWYLYHLALKEKATDRLRTRIVYLIWYINLAFRPNSLDEAVFRLPNFFYPLYYLLRPIRLGLAYGKPVAKKDAKIARPEPSA